MIAGLYALICLIWGSTWLVIKIGLVGVPPFLGAGLRFALASAVLLALVLLRGGAPPLGRDDRIAVLSCGLASFTLSYACVYWAEQHISSGLTASTPSPIAKKSSSGRVTPSLCAMLATDFGPTCDVSCA